MRIFSILGLSATIAGAVPRAKFDANDLVIRNGKNSVCIHDVLGPHAYYGTIHAVHRRGLDFFVVYGTSEMSRSGPRKMNGEFGLESYIRWLHVRDGKIVEQQEGRQESSLMNREGGAITWHHGNLVWGTDGFVGEESGNMIRSIPMAFAWTYNPSSPELGINETKKPRVWTLKFKKGFKFESPLPATGSEAEPPNAP